MYSIKQEKRFGLRFTPYSNKQINNYTHTDIYDFGEPPFKAATPGEPEDTDVTLLKEEFLKKWQFYKDSSNLSHESIQPPKI